MNKHGVAQGNQGLAIQRRQVDRIGDIDIADIAERLLLLCIVGQLVAVRGGTRRDRDLVVQRRGLDRRADDIGDQGLACRLRLEGHRIGLEPGRPQALAFRAPQVKRVADRQLGGVQGVEAGRA